MVPRYLIFFLLSIGMVLPQPSRLTLNEVLSIGGKKADSREFLGHPAYTGENNRYIYIADRGLRNIKVYSHDGKFVKQIGREGKGPGEFMAIYGIYVDNDELIVMDDQLMRFTRFTVEGEVKSTHFYRDLGITVGPRDFTKISNGNYLLVYATGSSRGDDPDFSKNIIHEVSPNFKEVISSFGAKDLVFAGDEQYRNISEADPGYIAGIGSKVIFAPRIYGGKLFVFEKEEGKWRHSTLLENREIKTPLFEMLSEGRSRNPKANYRAFLPEGKIKNYFIPNFSREVGIYENELLVHFVDSALENNKEGREKKRIVEVYDIESGKLLHFGEPVIAGSRDRETSGDLSESSADITFGKMGHVYEIEVQPVPIVRKYELVYQQ